MGRFKKQRFTAEERTAYKLRRHERLRFIKQRYQHSELLHGEFFHAGDQALASFLSILDGKGPILAACNERHARRLDGAGYNFVWQVERPVSSEDVMLGKVFRKPEAQGSLARMKFSAPLKGAFVCERLEEQGNLHDYLVALRNTVEVDAPICLVVPNAHHELIDDHVNLFSAGTLIYNLVRAGWNCKDATVWYDKRFINVLMRRRDVPEPWPTRVDDIGQYTPFRNVFNYCSSEFVEVYK